MMHLLNDYGDSDSDVELHQDPHSNSFSGAQTSFESPLKSEKKNLDPQLEQLETKFETVSSRIREDHKHGINIIEELSKVGNETPAEDLMEFVQRIGLDEHGTFACASGYIAFEHLSRDNYLQVRKEREEYTRKLSEEQDRALSAGKPYRTFYDAPPG
ncbi:hypothetical protein BLNAU_11291 [Blattamonas nauphoetae]|uniref:Uncharacterized protein n=1 Tax=Blattamonas nauphoetae TaxID=2049346 RepID=A0ABQ9XPS6_9EUKA|nr:hypothetical protein BLNAU_11291 [Blattamonas nauphoetae]